MAQTTTTTTTVTTTSVNQGFQLQVDPQSNTQIVGNFVTDVGIQPYIADQIVSFSAINMRPNQRIHVFFDSVLVDQYCAPGIKVSNDTSVYTSIVRTDNWGSAIYTDVNGKVSGQFSIPGGTFKTGDRVLEITDVDSLALGNDAMTTMASATFTASNLSVTKQVVTLTTVNPQLTYIPVTNTIVTVNTFSSSVTAPDIYNITQYYWEPLAQALTINTPNMEAGLYATSLDLYFKQKSLSNTGVLIYLCETNNGYPDGSTVLPFSLVYKDYADINVSNNATSATRFTFESPVYLQNQKTYAFIVKPDNNDPDLQAYTANLGNLDITTNIQVSSQPVIGTAFYGSTVKQWTALQTEYVKFNLNVANFSGANGTAIFNNTNEEYLTVYNVGYPNTQLSILPGDVIYQATNSFSNSTSTTVNTSVYGVIDYYDRVRQLLYIANSTGNFTSNSFVQIHRYQNSNPTAWTPNTSSYVAYANTYLIYNPRVNAVLPEFATITPPGTSITYEYVGTTNTYTTESKNVPINVGYESDLYDYERIVASRSNEVSYMSGNKSMTVNARLTTDSYLLSPIIDTVKADQLVIRNLIDPISSVYEEFFNNGTSRSKYISQIITLADGQDAEDLQIILSAYRPPTSDVQVWIRFLNGDDPDSVIENKTWTPMRNTGSGLFSNPTNPDDFREFTYTIPYQYPMIPTTGTITVASGNTSVVGANTLFGNGTYGNAEVFTGWYINMRANSSYGETSRRIVSITDNTHLTIDTSFGAAYTNAQYFIVPPPTTAWLSQNTSTQITGNVTISTTNNAVIGSGTTFTNTFTPGSIISVANDSQIVVSVSNNTYLTVGTPWGASVTGANAYAVSSAGLTYINSSGSRFSSFKKFQIKIVLQSNDSSKVPILDNLRALALQL